MTATALAAIRDSLGYCPPLARSLSQSVAGFPARFAITPKTTATALAVPLPDSTDPQARDWWPNELASRANLLRGAAPPSHSGRR